MSLLVPNASVARQCRSSPRTTTSQMETSSLLASNASVPTQARKADDRALSLMLAVFSLTPVSSPGFCAPTSCSQVARPFSKGSVNAEIDPRAPRRKHFHCGRQISRCASLSEGTLSLLSQRKRLSEMSSRHVLFHCFGLRHRAELTWKVQPR